MIIIGYPGIGKSTLAGRYKEYIDLESSNWNNIDNTKPDNWWWSYGRVAEDLSRQGYRVFVSCHPQVQKYFEESTEYVMVCYPSLHMKDDWTLKLAQRYKEDRSMKNLAALNNVDLFYDKQIKELNKSKFKHKCVLEDMNYTLDTEIDKVLWGQQK